jgi:hypothetical protein
MGHKSTHEISVTVDNTAPVFSLNSIRVEPTAPNNPVSWASGVHNVYHPRVYVTAIASDSTTYVEFMKFTITEVSYGSVRNIKETNDSKDQPIFGPLTEPIDLRTEEVTTIQIMVQDIVGNATSKTITLRYLVPDVEKLLGEAGGTVESPDGTKIVIPVNALAGDTLIGIHIPVGERPTVWDTCLVPIPSTCRVISPENLVFLKWVSITVPYDQYEIDRLGITDESKLALFYWDGAIWNRVSEAGGVDATANTITAKVNHGGLFCIMEDTRTTTASFAMYLTSNPFSPNGDGRKDFTLFRYRLDKAGAVTIKVYDMAGDLVKTLADGVSIDDTGWYHEARWNGDNDFGNYVGSGLYVFKLYVKFNDGSTKTVLKPVGVIK